MYSKDQLKQFGRYLLSEERNDKRLKEAYKQGEYANLREVTDQDIKEFEISSSIDSLKMSCQEIFRYIEKDKDEVYLNIKILR